MSTFRERLQFIRALSSRDLTRKIEKLAAEERRQGAWLIAHLAEISRRQLHLDLGYASLFEYCVNRLGLTEGCTHLRIQVARVCQRHPDWLDAVAEGRISLTAAGKPSTLSDR